MSVSPITISRVSSNMQQQLLLKGMRRGMLQMLESQEQLSSGLRVLRPSDDPIDTTAAMRLEDVLEAQRQYLANINDATKVMNLADATAGSISDVAMEAHSLVLENVGATATADQRQAAAASVDSMITQLVTLGNAEYLGRFLFAGTQSSSAPFSQEGNAVRFGGDDGEVTVQVSNEISETVNLTAGEVFGSGTGLVRSDHDLKPAATTATRLTDLAGAEGQGIRRGTLVIEGSVIGQVQVDISSAATVGDVIDQVNDALPAAVQMSLDATGRYLRITSSNVGETLQVTEAGQGTVAHDLGLYRPTGAGSPIVGDDFGAKLVLHSDVAGLDENAGFDVTSGIVITNGDGSITLNFASAQTIQDVLNAINTADIGASARITDDGTGIEIVNRLAGTELRIAENGGTTAADLGIRTFDAGDTLASLNGGRGVQAISGDDFRIVTRDGAQVDVDVSSAETIQDVIDQINAAATSASVAVTASFATVGNGIVLTDSTGGAGTLRVQRLNLSYAAGDLGLLKESSAGSNQIVSDDVNAVREQSLFTHLIGLRDALMQNDTQGIEQAGAGIEARMDQLNQYRGKLGFMARGLEARRDRTEDAVLSTESMLSEIKDLDFAEAISTFQHLQTVLQANLMTGGQILNTSLLDFLR